MMFAKEIQNKNIVSLYDNNLKLLKKGVLTGFKEKPGCFVIDHSLFFPITLVAKMVVDPKSESVSLHRSARLRI